MDYINAADVLPNKLLKEIQMYVNGGLLYIPKEFKSKKWGVVSDSREFYLKGQISRQIPL